MRKRSVARAIALTSGFLWRPDFALVQAWLFDQLRLQAAQWILWLPVFLALGIGFYFSLKTEPPFILGLFALFLFSSIAALLFSFRYLSLFFNVIYKLSIVSILISIGFLFSQIQTYSLQTIMLEDQYAPVQLEGVIESVEVLPGGEGRRVVIKNPVVEDLAPEKTPQKIRLTLRNDADLKRGQKISGLAGLNPPSPPVMPGAFDFQRYMFFQGIGAVGFFYGPPAVKTEAKPLFYNLAEYRQNLITHIETHIDYPVAGIVITLMTGQKKALAEEDLQAMRDSGLAHLLAISGLHVGMIAGFVFFSLRFLLVMVPGVGVHAPVKKYAAVMACFAALAYTLMVGAPVPTQRALIMTSLFFLAIILDRNPLSLRFVALAALAVLVISPSSLTSVSFQMSFAAVVALICFYEWARPWIRALYFRAGIPQKIALYFLGVCLTTIIAGFATAPFALYHFQHYANYGVLANLLAVPIVTFFVMPLVVLSFLLYPLDLSFLSLKAVAAGADIVLEVAHWTAGLENAVLTTSFWPFAGFLWLVIGLLLLCLIKGVLRIFCLVPLCAALFLIFSHQTPDVQIAESGDLMGVLREDKNFILSSRVSERFVGENWIRLYGLEGQDIERWPQEGRDPAGNMVCGESGCRLVKNGVKISFLRKPQIIQEECLWAHLILSPDPVFYKNCGSRIIIDKFFLHWNGATSVLAESPHQIEVHTDKESRGGRPWSPYQ